MQQSIKHFLLFKKEKAYPLLCISGILHSCVENRRTGELKKHLVVNDILLCSSDPVHVAECV